MTQHNFGKIQPVPALSDFLDIVLSRTQRKTPTVVHKGYAITRIRSFYMRKVKYTRDTFDEKLGAMLEDFPRIEDIHPFYGDLLNVLYDKDHYKLALGQMNTARHLIDNVAKDYLKLLKYGDSLYRCKQLKRAALGRMATIMKRQRETLLYLEQVRQHLSRLPAIDPNTRTLLLCGYPNVGKSSFMNKLTRARVDVQPYAFTTKSLFVGHMDYRYLRWQVIDTPGILDHALEERNTIEMQSITALAHIRACVLFFLDVSESCGYTLVQQVDLFNSLRPLFANKPVMLVCNKVDLLRPSQLQPEDYALLQSLLDQGVEMAEASCLTEEGVMEVRNAACEKLLALRVESKLRSQKIHDVLNKLHLAQPVTRDERTRPPCIPSAVQRRVPRAMGSEAAETNARTLARDIEAENGGAGVYSVDLKASYLLADPSWRYDAIPEILDGRNVADFIDPEIDERLRRLEEEEAALEASGAYIEKPVTEDERAFRASVAKLKARRRLGLLAHEGKRSLNRPQTRVERAVQRASRPKRSADSDEETHVDMETDAGVPEKKRRVDTDRVSVSRNRSQIRGVSQSRGTVVVRDRSVAGLRDGAAITAAAGHRQASQKFANRLARRGEADREVSATKPKHLFSGKRTGGTHDRR
jgi:nucleolar GTP-binding protein